jgi:hypothetical protein
VSVLIAFDQLFIYQNVDYTEQWFLYGTARKPQDGTATLKYKYIEINYPPSSSK